jgi:F-type H+-transporting ATPase subunit b
MEFNVSTFIFEIVNFLVLLWILRRLFYKPLLEIIAKRKQSIDQSLDDTQKLNREANELRVLYENRGQLWEQEKQAALVAFQRQLDAEKKTQMEMLHGELEQERQKAKVTLSRQQEEFQRQAEQQALQNGARFAGLLLQQAVGPELETRLVQLFVEQLATLPEDFTPCPHIPAHKKSLILKVASAYPLALDPRQQLEQKLAELIDCPLNFQYHEDTTLIAGIRIDIGAWVLHANLKQELSGFADIAHESE